jgi:Protein of unknown function (DUF998)
MRTRTLLNFGVVAGPLFVATYTVLGRRQSGYMPRRDPVSSLVLGDQGAVQVASFLVTGALTCAAASGLRAALGSDRGSAAIPLLTACAGIGFVGAGSFPTDPVGESSLNSSELTSTGKLHVVSAVPVFSCLPFACLVGAGVFSKRGNKVWALYSTTCGVTSMAAAALAGSGFAGNDRVGEHAGTFQRIALVAGLGWLSSFSARLRIRAL